MDEENKQKKKTNMAWLIIIVFFIVMFSIIFIVVRNLIVFQYIPQNISFLFPSLPLQYNIYYHQPSSRRYQRYQWQSHPTQHQRRRHHPSSRTSHKGPRAA